MASDDVVRTKGPLEPEADWYDDEGRVIVTGCNHEPSQGGHGNG